MKTKDIIYSGLKSFDTLLDFIKKKINFNEAESHKFKVIIEGRKSAFEVAVSQLTKIRQLEEAESCFKEKEHRDRLSRLVESTESILKEITKVLEKDIDVDDSEDEKVKSIVQSKELSFDLLLSITSVRDDITQKLKTDQPLGGNQIRNLASERVKVGK